MQCLSKYCTHTHKLVVVLHKTFLNKQLILRMLPLILDSLLTCTAPNRIGLINVITKMTMFLVVPPKKKEIPDDSFH